MSRPAGSEYGPPEFVAEVVPAGRGAAARPAFVPGRPVLLARAARGAAEIGDLVLVRRRGRGVRVAEVLGSARSVTDVLQALLDHDGPGREFSRDALAEAEAAAGIDVAADAGRRDLTDQPVITIDPEGAKDHDDAVAAQVEGDAVRLWVHIADVSRYVSVGGALDQAAAERGLSTYVPGLVAPMLPYGLSAGACSLSAGAPRAAVTVEMVVEPDGAVGWTRFSRSLIRSRADLTYPDVDAHFAGVDLPVAGLAEPIAAVREAARRLRARRLARGALELETGEPVFEIVDGRVVGASRRSQTEAQRVIEDCMVAANEAVARHLIARGQPVPFRVHDDPASASVERLYDQLARLDVATPPLPDGPLGPAAARGAAAAAATAVARHVAANGDRGARGLPGLVLRSLRRAHYAVERTSHSGLASPAYLHFTSPIRRYPDLLVHRALLASLGGPEPVPSRALMATLAGECSLAEQRAAGIERRADAICAALLVAERHARREPLDRIAGEVVGVIDAGAFVAFEPACEGMMPARLMTGRGHHLDDLEVALVSDAGGRGLRIGDPVEVRVIGVEPLRGRVTLAPADDGSARR